MSVPAIGGIDLVDAQPVATEGEQPRWVRWAPYLTWSLFITPACLYSLTLYRWGAPPPMWVLSASQLAVYAIVGREFGGRRGIVAAVVAVLPVVALVQAWVATSLTLPQLVWVAVGSTVQAAVSLGTFWLLGGARKWLARDPADLLRMLAAAFVPAIMLAFLGVLPDTHRFIFDAHDLVWALRSANVLFIGAMVMPILWWHPGRPRSWRREMLIMVPLLLVGVMLLRVYYNHTDAPMTWAVLFPSLLAGWVLSPKAAALYTCVVAGTDMLYFMSPANELAQLSHSGTITPLVVAELLSCGTSLACMLIALLRYVSNDLTESLRQERAEAAAGAELLGGVFDAISEGVLVLGPRGEVLRRNETIAVLFGMRLEGDLDQWAPAAGLRHFDGTLVSRHSIGFAEVCTGTDVDHELLLMRSGRTSRLALHLTAYDDGAGSRVLAVVRDVTSERLRAEELRSFAGVVAHDLRTPLTTLRGWLEVLDDALAGHPSPSVAKAAAAALHGSRRLAGVVDDWLSFTVGRDADLEFDDRTVASLVSDAVQDLEGGALVTMDAADLVHVDPALVRQVFANLLGNAVKYSREGVRPQIRVRSTADHRPGLVRIEVRDNGLGVPLGDEDRIFDEFQRSHVGRSQGTGLGLALCRRIVERHGGTIGVHGNGSAPGSTFWFTLPAPLPSSDPLGGEPRGEDLSLVGRDA